MISSGYTLDLYCDNTTGVTNWHTWPSMHDGGFAEYTGETWGQCVKAARRDGWLIGRDRQKAICPGCRS